MNMKWGRVIALAAALLACVTPATANAVASDPQAMAQEMVQNARRTMLDDPSKVEADAIAFERRVGSLPASNRRSVALAKALWMMGEATMRQHKLDLAGTRLKRAEDLARRTGDDQTIADVTMSQAVLDEELGNPGGAARKYQSAYKTYETLKNRRAQSIALQNMAALYLHANDAARAATYLRQAASIYRDEAPLLVTIQNNLGNIYTVMKQPEVAEREYEIGQDMARRNGMALLELQFVNNRVRTLMILGRTGEAIRVGRRGVYLVESGMTGATPHYLGVQAMIAGARGERSLARAIADPLVAKLRQEKPNEVDPDLHEVLYDAYKRIGAMPEALAQLEIAKLAQERQTRDTLSMQNALLGAQFDYANQDLRIAQLQSDRILASAKEERRSFYMMAVIGVTILGAMGIGLNSSRRSRKKITAINEKLAKTNADLKDALEEVVLRERAERQAIQLAEHDILTGLPNRRHLMGNLLGGVIEEGQDSTQVAIMLMDLDRFKPINDIHGHEIGDMLLVEVAARLRAQCDTRKAKAVRLGGDEFVIVCALQNGEDGSEFAAETIRSLNMPFDIEGRRLTIGVSIGVSIHARDGTEVSDLLRKADISMYEAKRCGRNTCRFFDEKMDVRLRERAQTEADLHVAVQEEMIDVHYQPIHNFDTGRTASFEALARWTHPLRGPVSPEEFIPIAEDIGLISRITDMVLRQACSTAKEWPSDVSVSVNLSPMLLGDEWLVPRIFKILAEEGLAPHRLIIEITENAVISDVKHAAEVIGSLRASGIRIALDDFGKGHSSLSQLHELAFDYLKLDSSFVRTLDNPHSMKISAAVSGMAKAMEIPVTAEGIESQDIANTLEGMGFNYGQGYLYGRPMTAPNAREMAWNVHVGGVATEKAA